MKRCLLCVVVLVAVSAAVTAWALAAAGGNPNPRVVPAKASVGGLSYSEWGDRYNQWLLSIPRSVDLLASPGVGQDPASPVFFLPSASGPLSEAPIIMEGEITVPAGKILLLPVYWLFNTWMPRDCCTTTPEDYLACSPDLLDWALSEYGTGLYASVDGQPIRNLEQYRASSAEPFGAVFPSDNIYGTMPCAMGAFTSDLVMSDGYWLMLTPLAAGEHVVRFGSDNLHTTLYLTVPAHQ